MTLPAASAEKEPRWKRLLEKLESGADRAAGQLERHKYLFLILFSIAYFSFTAFRASRKLLWYDEIFTLSISRLASLHAIWAAVSKGVDFNPPLFYLITGWSDRLPLNELIRSRLPEMIGFWILSVCLFRFIWLRSTAAGAFVAMLFPMATMAYWYSYDARPHGMVLAFCGLALVCWQAAASERPGRLWPLLGLGAALASAMLTHSYAFLLFAPVIAGELIRDLRRRRVDWPIWVVVAISASALLASVPLIRALHATFAPQWFPPPTLHAIASSYASLLRPAALALFAFLALMCLPWSRPSPHSRRPTRLREHELAAFLALAALPVLAYIAAKITHAPMIPRYSLSAIAGLAGLIGIGVSRRPVAALGTLLAILAVVGLDLVRFNRAPAIAEPTVGYSLSTSRAIFSERYRWMENSPHPGLPVVLLSNSEFAASIYYSPAALAPRLTYVLSDASDFNGVDYAMLEKCCGLNRRGHVFQSKDFVAAHPEFLAYGGFLDLYKLGRLRDKGARISIEDVSGDQYLVLVKTKGDRQDAAGR